MKAKKSGEDGGKILAAIWAGVRKSGTAQKGLEGRERVGKGKMTYRNTGGKKDPPADRL